MGRPYVPPGYTGIVAATKTLAAKLYPERWDYSVIPTEELRIWNGLEVSLNAELIESHLTSGYPNRTLATINRIIDCREARKYIQDALFTSEIRAIYQDDLGRELAILPARWAAVDVDDILLSGRVPSTDGLSISYHVLLPIAQIENLITALTTCDKTKKLDTDSVRKTGAAGRPTSMHLIMAEARQRLAAGTPLSSMTKFAADLSEWLCKAHPEAPRTTPKTVMNNGEFRALVGPRLPSRN